MKIVYSLLLGSLTALSAHASNGLAAVGVQCRIDVAASKAKAAETGLRVSELQQFSLHVADSKATAALRLGNGPGSELITFPDLFNFTNVAKVKQSADALSAEIEYITHDTELFKVNVSLAGKSAIVTDHTDFDCGGGSDAVAVYTCLQD